jgi:DNA-binding NarL/FixJ family response regulator
MPARVAIVDDNLWVRHGRAAALCEQGEFDVVELEHRQALEFGKDWAAVDVALVDAHDGTEPFDRFAGVGVVEALRAHGRPTATAVVVSRLVANPYLGLRLAEAGADYCFHHEEVADPDALVEVTTRPSAEHRVVRPGRTALATMGLGPAARPNAALRYLVEEGLEGAFDGRRSQKSLELSRRTIMRVRREIGRLTGLHSPIGAARDLDSPDWRTVVDFVNRARGVELRQLRHSGSDG